MIATSPTASRVLASRVLAIAACLSLGGLLAQGASAQTSPISGKSAKNASSASTRTLTRDHDTFLCIERGGHTSVVRGLVFDDAHGILLSAGDDKSLRTWNLDTNSAVGNPARFAMGTGENGMLRGLALDAASGRAAVMHRGQARTDKNAAEWDSVLIWGSDAKNPDALDKTVLGGIDTGMRVYKGAIAYSPDGKFIAVSGVVESGAFSQVRVFHADPNDKEFGKRVCAFPKKLMTDWADEDAPESPQELTQLQCLVYSPDGKRIAAGDRSGWVRLFDAQTGKMTATKRFAVRRPVEALAWGGDAVTGTPALAVGVEDQVYAWNPDSNLFDKRAAGNHVTCLAMDKAGRIVIGVGSNNPSGVVYSVMLWDRRLGASSQPVRIGEQDAVVSAVALAANGERAASSDESGCIYLWNTETKAAAQGGRDALAVLGGRPALIDKLRWDEDGHTLAWTNSKTGEALRWAGAFDFAQTTYLPAELLAESDTRWQAAPGDAFRADTSASGAKGVVPGAASVDSVGFAHNAPPRLLPNIGPDTYDNNGTRQLPRLVYPNGAMREIPLPIGETVLCGTIARPNPFKRDYLVVLGTSRGLSVWAANELPGGETAPLVKVRELYGFEQLPLDVAVTNGKMADKKAAPETCLAAATLGDGTIRVWNLLDTPELLKDKKGNEVGTPRLAPLVSLYATSDTEWVAWNDQTGYYAASPNGDNLIGWQVNPVQRFAMAEYRPADDLKGTKYQPDVIAALLSSGSLAKASMLAKVSDEKVEKKLASVPRVVIGDVTVNGVALPRDSDGTYITTNPLVSVKVAALSTAGESMTAKCTFDYFAARTPQRGARNLKAGAGQTLVVAGLAPALNPVTITARDASGSDKNVQPVTIRIRYDAPKSTAQATRPKPNLYVLAIGVQKFTRAQASVNLRYPEADARSVAEAFLEQKGKQFGEVKTVYLPSEKATQQGIADALAQMKTEVNAGGYQAHPDDLVVLYVSSHGLLPEYTDNKGFYLVASDSDLSSTTNAAKTAVPLSSLVESLQAVKASNALLLMDQCFAGGVVQAISAQSQSASEREGRRAVYGRAQRARSEAMRTTRESAMAFTTLAAATSEQRSWENEAWQHGAFTYALLRALRGELDGVVNKDGQVTLRRAATRIQEEVEELVAARGLPAQSPQLIAVPGADAGRVPLALLVRRKPAGQTGTRGTSVGSVATQTGPGVNTSGGR